MIRLRWWHNPMNMLITYLAIYGLLFRYRDFWYEGLVLGLGVTVFIGFGGEQVNIAPNRRRFLRRRGVDLTKCVLLYYGWLWSELIMTPGLWYQRTWGPWPTGWRDVTPMGYTVAARYNGWLRGLTITYGGPCERARLTIEPLRRRWAAIVVENLLRVSPDATVEGLPPRKSGEAATPGTNEGERPGHRKELREDGRRD